MAKAVKKVKTISAKQDAKAEIKALKAEIKALKAKHKEEIQQVVGVTYDRAVQAAFDEFEQREMAREIAIEKAVNKALADFEKGLAKQAKKAVKASKKTKKSKKKSTAKTAA